VIVHIKALPSRDSENTIKEGLAIYPSSYHFTSSSSSLKGSFALLVTNASLLQQKFILALTVTGNSAAEFYNATTTVTLIDEYSPPLAVFVLARFGDNGKMIFLHFDSATDYGRMPMLSSWNCSWLFQFVSVAKSVCTWQNATAVKLVLTSIDMTTSDDLLLVGSNVTLRSSKVRHVCTLDIVYCHRYLFYLLTIP
jgi:hypothetical protein